MLFAGRAVQEAQLAKGHTVASTGMALSDSGCVLKEFLTESESLECFYNSTEKESLIKKIEYN